MSAGDETYILFQQHLFYGTLSFPALILCFIASASASAFGYCILQAANYGLPQSRRRMIIIACAPGEKLPGGFVDRYEREWPRD